MPLLILHSAMRVIVIAIAICCLEYEARTGLPRGTIRQAVIGQAFTAYEQLERGEISMDEFSRKFSDECSEVVSRFTLRCLL